jgi:hypothetical protein
MLGGMYIIRFATPHTSCASTSPACTFKIFFHCASIRDDFHAQIAIAKITSVSA